MLLLKHLCDCVTFSQDFKNGFGSLIHPGDDTKKDMSIGHALKLYYTIAIIPFILFLVIGSAYYGTIGAASYACHVSAVNPTTSISCGPHNYFSIFDGFIASAAPSVGVVGAVFLADIVFLLIVPVIGIFIDSLIYHLIGRSFLKEFKRPWDRTFTGVMYGALPALALYWLLFIPIFGYVILAIVTVWGFINGIIAISNQQRIDRLHAFGVYLVTLFIILLIALIFSSAALTSILSAPIYGPVIP